MKKLTVKQILLILLGVVCVAVVAWDAVKINQLRWTKNALEKELWHTDTDYTILREVESIEVLQEPFAAQPEVYFAQEPETDTKVYALLAERKDATEPNGYGAGYTVQADGIAIHYSRVCSTEKPVIDSNKQYCGILYRLESADGNGELCFSFRDYGYSLRYTMETKGLKENEIDALEEKANEELFDTMRDIINQYAEALKEEYRSGEKFDLTPEEIKQKTYLMVTATGDFVVVNAEGESFSNVGGYALGTMPVYGIDFMTGGSPVPYCFLVDHSASFTCIATEEDSSIMEFLASGEKASGYISADKEEDGWTKITFDDQEHIFKEP